jgi:thiamine-monophosphate kinase
LRIVADLSLIGEVEEDRLLRRSGAKLGDAVLVTGHLGTSACGLRIVSDHEERIGDFPRVVRSHLEPCARVAEGRVLSASGEVHAMIDLSDGLSTDLSHMCRESAVGAEIDWNDLPVEAETRAAAASLNIPLPDLVLSGGEDYELLFTAAETRADKLAERVHAETGTPISRIGRITELERGIRIRDAKGKMKELVAEGWDHFDSRNLGTEP